MNTWSQKLDFGKYFPDGKANDYSKGQEFFVNVYFINPVSIINGNWTKVRREHNTRVSSQQDSTGLPLSNKLLKWGEI